jgi:hypothetical protein
MQPRIKEKIFNIIAILIVIFPFIKLPFNHRSTGWDTFDVYTINLTYFADSLSNLIVPLWNPFVLSGISFISNLFTYYLFGPIDLVSALLGVFISPFSIAELNIILAVVLIYIGNHKILRNCGVDKTSAFIGAFVSSTVFAVPLAGQIPMLYSFAMLPWLILFILEKEHRFIIFKSFLISALFIKGYFYFNALIFVFCYLLFAFTSLKDCQKTTPKKVLSLLINKKNLLFFIPLSLFIVLTAEATYHFLASYSIFKGDLIIEEPRIRPLLAGEQFFIKSIAKGFITLIYEGSWTNGLGPLSFFFFILALLGLFNLKKINHNNKPYLLPLSIISLLGFIFSIDLNFIKEITKRLPILSSHRWHFTNIFFSIWAMSLILSLLFDLLSDIKKNNKYLIFFKKAGLATCILTSLFYHFNYTGQMELYDFKKQTRLQALKKRDRTVTVHKNIRSLNKENDLAYNDYSWMAEKKLISHGYNNTTPLFYWYLKDMPLNENIISSHCYVRTLKKNERSSFKSDNNFLRSFIDQVSPTNKYILTENDISKDLQKCTPFSLIKVAISPNQLTFSTQSDGSSLAFISNTFAPGWKAYIDNQETKIQKTNLTFQGIIVPQGTHEVSLVYKPVTFYLILAWYFVMTFLLLFEYLNFHAKKSR